MCYFFGLEFLLSQNWQLGTSSFLAKSPPNFIMLHKSEEIMGQSSPCMVCK